MKQVADSAPILSMTDERLDYANVTPVRKSYLIASSYRSGSTYLSWLLWKTGLLGAPSETLNPTSELVPMMNRFRTTSPAEYLAKLLEKRTGRNGVFGMKAHFHHFEGFLKQYPEMLEVLDPLSFVYINRTDKVAQAVSMAKALQTNKWTSRVENGPKPVVNYDRELIARCLVDIEQQDQTWIDWFEAHKVTPFHVTYNDLIADTEGVVRRIVEMFGVQNDEPEDVLVPMGKKQGDETNQEWISRFESESKSGAASAPAEAKAAGAGESGHFIERYADVAASVPAGAASATGFFDLIRLRRRYDVLVGRNAALFSKARVLDVMSDNGFWSLAALDAGASHVTSLELTPNALEAGRTAFATHKVDPARYAFVDADVFRPLESFAPGAFDLVFCQGSLEHRDIRRFFASLGRLRPKQVILDTGMVSGEGPIVRFTRGLGEIVGMPNHHLIMFMADAYGYRWRLFDWRSMGFPDWTGIHEYERDHRRSYILERAD